MKIIPIQFRREEHLMSTVMSILDQRYDWLPNIGIFESRTLTRTNKQHEKVPITTLSIAPENIHAIVYARDVEGEYDLRFYQNLSPGQPAEEEVWVIKYPPDFLIWAAHEIADLIALTFYYERGFFDEDFIRTWDLEHPLSDHTPTLMLPDGGPNVLTTARVYSAYRTTEKTNVPTEQDSGGASS